MGQFKQRRSSILNRIIICHNVRIHQRFQDRFETEAGTQCDEITSLFLHPLLAVLAHIVTDEFNYDQEDIGLFDV